MTNRALGIVLSSAFGFTGLVTTILGATGFTTFLNLGDRGLWWLSIFATVGLAIVVSVAVIVIFRKASRKVRDWYSLRSILHTCRCDEADIKAISGIALDEFGDRSTSEAESIRLHSLDGRIFTAIKDSAHQIVGYICLVRLTKSGLEAVMRNDFRIASAPIEYINCSTKWKYHNIYVGAVYGRDRISKAFALGSMMQELTDSKARVVCARAATQDGLRILKKYGFQPISGRPDAVGELFWRNGPMVRP